jgi:hypothetical protein
MSKLSIKIAERRTVAFGASITDRIVAQLLDQNVKINDRLEDEDEPEVITLTSGNVEYSLPFVVGIDPALSKSVLTTTINDAEQDGEFIGGGEVVESWGNKGWDLAIRGLIIDTNNHNRPLQQILQFVNVIRQNTIYEVTSNLFNSLDIRRIYITNVSLPTLEGFKDTQPYVIQARSYVPAIIQIND